MAWRADTGGFPSTLCLAAASGRQGADDAAGGPARAAPWGGYGLVSTLPLGGGRFYRRLRIATVVAGVCCFCEPHWLVLITP